MNMDQQQQRKKTPEQMVEAIFALDLDPIKFKLMDQQEGQGWSRAKVDAVELEYRRFLALTARYPGEAITPDTDVDKFWHGHILDTIKYEQDCHETFGYFLHHYPYFGMRDEEDAVNLTKAAARTKALYEKEFGAVASKGEASAYCGAVGNAYCGATAVKQAGTAYCGATAAKQADTTYCGATAAKQADAAYCGAAGSSFRDVITGKDRPKMQPGAAM